MSIYVQSYPTQISTPDGTIYNPTEAQCIASGYVLGEDPAVVAQRQSDEAAAKTADDTRKATLSALQQAYRDATAQLCQLAGIAVVPVLAMAQVQAAVMPLLSGTNAATVNGLITLLTNVEGKLCRLDGNDALDRV